MSATNAAALAADARIATRFEVYLWAAQRVTAIFLAVFVLVHLVTVIYAVRGGLSAAEILARTHANRGIALFYGLFVLAAAIHGAIGLRTVAAEWLEWRGRLANAAVLLVGIALLGLGLRAVVAVCG